MKKLLLGICICSPVLILAQTTDEWLRQKATQKKYLLQQIAALHVYGNHLAKGYDIVKGGLATIQHLNEGDFVTHLDQFQSKYKVKANIATYSKVTDIQNYQSLIAKRAVSFKNFCKSNKYFTEEEKVYVSKVCKNLWHDSEIATRQLQDIISGKGIPMDDRERIAAIDSLYQQMQDISSFLYSFVKSATLLAAQRGKESNGLNIMKNLNEVK